MDKTARLGTEHVGSLLLHFSIPAIIGMLVNAMYNVVDRVFVGNTVGTLGITGITVSFPVMIIFMAFGMLIGIGGTTVFSIRLGERKREEASTVLGNVFTLLLLVSITLSAIVLIFLDPVLVLFGASKASIPYARSYLSIILIGMPVQAIGFGMNNFIRAEGSPKTAMATMIIGAVLNIILDPVFIILLDMGVRGAALATVLAQSVSSAWVLSYFLGKRSAFTLRAGMMRLRMSLVKRIVAVGMAPFAMQMAASVVVALFNSNLLKYGGDTAISAFGIINSVTMFIIMPILGINQGAQPIIGYNYGAGQEDRVRAVVRRAIVSASVIVLLGFVATMVFPGRILSLFNRNDPDLLALGVRGMRIFLAALPVVGFQIVGSGYFQAVGKAKKAMFLSLSRQVLILVPALLILPRIYGLEGVWLTSPISDLLSAAVTAYMLLREFRTVPGKQARDNASPVPR